MTKINMSLAEIEALAFDALRKSGTSEKNARPLAVATAQTEAIGVSSHGLAYIPIYCEHVQCAKVDGTAIPSLSQPAASLSRVDAGFGFAHPAIDLGFEALIPAAKTHGIAALSITNSYNCGVLGYHTTRIAEAGCLGLGFTNAPASIAPVGAVTPLLGTNPMSLAAPGPEGEPVLVIDQSASAIAKSEVMKHAREGRPIPLGWALDPDGNPTEDPALGLKGSMAPAGGYKGVGAALIAEVMAAALTGAALGKDASPFSGTAGGPPGTGQFFIAIAPDLSADGQYFSKIAALSAAFIEDDHARLPGLNRRDLRRKAIQNGVEIDLLIYERVKNLA